MGPASLWNTAAAQCVVVQAGSGMIQLAGEPLSYVDPADALNPFFVVHEKSAVNWAEWV